jgi:hypothetical protein
MRITHASTLAKVEAEIRAIAGALTKTRARLLELVGEFDAASAWVATGAPSCAHWLAELLDIELCTAREQVRVARALRNVPEVRTRFASGSLSYAKVRQLTRVATAENEGELLSLAERHPAGELARALAAWQRQHDPAAAAERQREERGLSIRDEPTGNRTVVAQLSASTIARFEALLDAEVRDAPAGASRPGVSLRHQRADAFARLIERMATRGASAGASGTGLRPELVLHRRMGETSLSDGTVLPAAVARQFTCDADLRVMTHLPNGSPTDVGRRYRIVPPRLRRLVLERDSYRCAFPGCRARHYLEVHHLVHWEDGGETVLVNLISLCGYHHTFVHENGWPAAFDPLAALVNAA